MSRQKKHVQGVIEALLAGAPVDLALDPNALEEANFMKHAPCDRCRRPSPAKIPVEWQPAGRAARVLKVCPGCAEQMKAPEDFGGSSDSKNFAQSSRRGDLDWIERNWYR